jgi:hypothetical protein
MKENKKAIFAGVMLLIAVVWLYSAFTPSAPPTPATPTRRQSAIASLTSDAAAPSGQSSGGAGKRGRGGEGVDPSLRLDLLAKLQATQYEGSDRNIFQFYTPPPPPPPKPIVSPIVNPGGSGMGQATPGLPPPPPPIPLKFYGLASAPGVSPRRAFLQEGEDIFIATEGDVIKKRYKILRIGEKSIEIEDMQTNNKQPIPLQES